jgi:hypothetical protein
MEKNEIEKTKQIDHIKREKEIMMNFKETDPYFTRCHGTFHDD